jgi:hypothetical protein
LLLVAVVAVLLTVAAVVVLVVCFLDMLVLQPGLLIQLRLALVGLMLLTEPLKV